MAKWSKPPAVIQKTIVRQLRQTVQVSYYNFIIKLEQRTPRLTGQLRNNWRTSLNAASLTIVRGPAQGSPETFASARRAMDSYQLGDTITLRNNLNYAIGIEYKGWSRVKAPKGMLRITAREWPQIVRQAAKAVKSGAKNETS